MEYYWELRSKNAQNIKALMCPLYIDENFKKSLHLICLHWLFYTFLKMHCYAKRCYLSLPISYNFHVMLLLENKVS